MKKYLFLLAFILALSCRNNKDKAPTDLNKSIVTIHLPFASSNYEDATNFILYDSTGKICVAEVDTVTKGGGTIIYENLPKGTYSYYIKTIFDEEIRKTLRIDSSHVDVGFYYDCYEVKDVIEFDTLIIAKKIDLRIETMNDADTNKVDIFKIEKSGERYLLRHNLADSKGWSNLLVIDSTKLINALTEFEITIIGLRETKIIESDYGYMGVNAVYLKCDNHFLGVWNLKNTYLDLALRKLKKALLKK